MLVFRKILRTYEMDEPYIGRIQEYIAEVYLTLQAKTPQNGQTHSICPLLPTNCLSVFDHFLELALKGLRSCQTHIFFLCQTHTM